METEKFIDSQNILYSEHRYLYTKKWYRKLFGGKWYLVKFGKDTPYIMLFAIWTKIDPKNFYGYTEVIETDNYPETGVDTNWKIFKEFFKQLIK